MAEGVCSTSSRTPNSQRVLPISLKGRVLRWKASRNNWRQEVIFTTMLEWSNGKEHCYLLRRNGKRIRQGSHERHQAVLCPRTPFATSDRLLPSGPRDHGATGGTEPWRQSHYKTAGNGVWIWSSGRRARRLHLSPQ